MIKSSKVIFGILLAFAAIVISALIIGFSFFVYEEATLDNGCEKEFCIGQTKIEAQNLFQGRYSFHMGTIVPYSPHVKSAQYNSANRANSIEELVTTDRWTIVYNPENGWKKFVHLNFEDNTLTKIEIVKYGPFYIDP